MWSRLLNTSEWWNHVTEIPDLSKIIVLRIGIWKGLRVLIPEGGHISPLSSKGFNLLWKNVQKKALKKSTSEKIKRIIPSFSPFWTYNLWAPWKALSRLTSRHHRLEISRASARKLKIKKDDEDLNITNSLIIKLKETIPIVNGQGLSSTKWKRWKDFPINFFL